MDLRTGTGSLCAAALLSGALVGCGSGDETISTANADDLHRQVDAVRRAAADGRNPAALAAVADLRSTVRRLASLGELDPADTLVLLTQVDRIENQIEARPARTPTPRPTPVPAPAAPAGNDDDDGDDDDDEGNGKGNGKGKENGKGKGKGDD